MVQRRGPSRFASTGVAINVQTPQTRTSATAGALGLVATLVYFLYNVPHGCFSFASSTSGNTLPTSNPGHAVSSPLSGQLTKQVSSRFYARRLSEPPSSQRLVLSAGSRGESDFAQEGADKSLPVVLLLHPDEGSPGFVEVPHMGDILGDAGRPSWSAAASQLAHRVQWDLGEPPAVQFRTLSLSEFCAEGATGAEAYSLVLGVDLPEVLPAVCTEDVLLSLKGCSTRVFISSRPGPKGAVAPRWRELTSIGGVGADALEDTGPLGIGAMLGGWAAAAKTHGDIVDLWHRRTAEEAVYAVLVLIDSTVMPLESMQAQKPVPTFETVTRAIDRCQDEFRACFTTPRCMQSLACLSSCGLADQSCSYNCIVSYQSEAFTQFSLCALQKQNLLNSQIKRPVTPVACPMETFRGRPLTEDVAEDILVGHYDPAANHKHSWLVAAGSNPAYEQFALQFQLWYRGSASGSFWYHPTFLVEALDGRKIWRDRDYRVRRQKGKPGIWEFSVLDNGIISEERWHLLGADDDLEWLVLFYIGAARKAGLAYRGCLVLTKDGQMPTSDAAAQGVAAAVARAGMMMWELEATNNPPIDPANPPPLIARLLAARAVPA